MTATGTPVPRPLLLFSWGNPSRGDDALGPALYDMVEAGRGRAGDFGNLDTLTDFQLQVEHVLDLRQRRWILFADASLSAEPPFEFRRLEPAAAIACTTHAMHPAALLALYRQVHAQPAPPAYLLSMRGYDFELGRPLSTRAAAHLAAAYAFVSSLPLVPPFELPDDRIRCA